MPPKPGTSTEGRSRADRAAERSVLGTRPKPPAAKKPGMKISQALIDMLGQKAPVPRIERKICPPDLPPGVVPSDAAHQVAADGSRYLAADDAGVAPYYTWAGQAYCGLGFPGYAYLSELAQRSEYRAASETIAKEMTRKWIKLIGKGKGDHQDRIEKLTAAMTEFGIQNLFYKLAEQDGFFGRGQLYINIKGQEDRRDIPLMYRPESIKAGDLIGFKTIEPIWTTPFAYNSNDPTLQDFFKPRSWFVLGKRTHASRLLTFISREVPDILKPAYNFGGVSMSQLMEPYVNQWLRTRDAVTNIVHSFSISGLATDMQAVLAGDGSDSVFKRAQLFTQTRDNRGMFLLDKDTEEFFQFNTPLSGLSELQAQAQEHQAAPTHIPLVKLLGITPTGLNASTEGEMDSFYDFVKSSQELMNPILDVVLRILQLNLDGKVDDAIGYEWVPLKELDGEAISRVRKADADSGVAYINSGVISPEEERERLAADPNSGYDGLEGPPPEPPDEPDDQGGESGKSPAE